MSVSASFSALAIPARSTNPPRSTSAPETKAEDHNVHWFLYTPALLCLCLVIALAFWPGYTNAVESSAMRFMDFRSYAHAVYQQTTPIAPLVASHLPGSSRDAARDPARAARGSDSTLGCVSIARASRPALALPSGRSSASAARIAERTPRRLCCVAHRLALPLWVGSPSGWGFDSKSAGRSQRHKQ